MTAADLAPSTALLEANRRLYELREATQADRSGVVSAERPSVKGGQPPGRPGPTRQATGANTSIATNLPRPRAWHLARHLGWDSPAITVVFRSMCGQRFEEKTFETAGRAPWTAARFIKAPPPEIVDPRAVKDTAKLYPDLALGMLHRNQAAAGRIWLLLRHLDRPGRGWLRIDLIQEKLTKTNEKLRVCGRRQLRNLLQQGRGIFWEQDKERVWLNSAARVAMALGVERLTVRPVELPVAILLGGIGRVRAHFYASFYSGRKSANPISRARLERITRVPERTQRVYEQQAGVTSQRNLAVGERYSGKEVQNRAWRHGRAVFEFIDAKGTQGPPGRRYVAWRLPNSYQGCHELSPRGRQRKINKQIGLVHYGAQGNGLVRANARRRVDRLFHRNGLEAGRAYNRGSCRDIYWTSLEDRSGSCRIWQVIAGRAGR